MMRTTFAAMGTEVILLVDESGLRGAGAVEAVQALFARWERRLSRFVGDSDVSRANRAAGRPVEVEPLTLDVLHEALRAARATGGAFDPTLGRQIAAAGYRRSFGLPQGVTVRGPAGIVPGGGWRRIRLDRDARTVTLPPDVAVDLGGIAKGMAVDAAARLLDDHEVAAALISAGGDMRAAGRRVRRWPVAFDDAPGEIVELTRGALATSSTARRRWEQAGAVQHHLIDPRTGGPSTSGLRAVSVAAPTCRQAEVAAKVALIRGPIDGAAFLTSIGVAALMTADNGLSIAVGAWPRRKRAAA